MIAGAAAHNWMFEAGAAGFISSIQVLIIPGDGRFTAEQVRATALPDQPHFSPTRLVSLENTHNMGGGRVWAADAVTAVVTAARELGLACHLDGARLWNAAAASGRSLAELADGFDTVSLCLSKGLGAPAVSVLCGSRGLIARARRVRRILGGAMRQAGILAAGGIYGIEHHRARLVEDHANARLLARGLNEIEGLRVELDAVDTNIVMVSLTGAAVEGRELVRRAGTRGVHFFAVRPDVLRFVTHLDVSRADCLRAVEVVSACVTERRAVAMKAP